MRDIVVDSHGFKYSRWREVGKSVYWRCCIRNKSTTCRATLIERGGIFKRGCHQHVDQPLTGRLSTAKVITQVEINNCLNVIFKAASNFIFR
jgi:hypothetical protein